MTAHARIPQADIERAAKVALKYMAKTGTPTRIVMDLRNERIELILGEAGESPPTTGREWNDDDV